MAVASAPLGSQTLEPHYLLGHGGHCPRSKPAHGKLSPSQVLTGLEGARPGQRRLPQPTWGRPARLDLPAEAAGEGLFSCCTIPGYTGFVPRAQNHFAKTHSQICREAGQEFARLQGRAAAGSLPCQGPLSPQDVQPVFEPFHAKETPQPAASPPQAPSCDFQSPGAPAAVEDGAPQKYFVPGLGGVSADALETTAEELSAARCSQDSSGPSLPAAGEDLPHRQGPPAPLPGLCARLQVPVWPHLRPPHL
ncbi:ciliary microtubule inner protein 2B isoform X2 [Paroedura picta]|uniref:ciliary microtubule inner protein 2B isoform X2 n=1 Tax=Paroedura picta TaxID=143630 RepID=UPI004055E6BA